MKRVGKWLTAAILAVVLAFALVLTGCSGQASVVSIEKTGSEGLQDIYTVTYSDGSTSEFTVANGSDGADVSIDEIYEKYKAEVDPSISYADFLQKYLSFESDDNSSAINKCLLSSAKVYTEFIVKDTSSGGWMPGIWGGADSLAIYTGGAVLYQMDDVYTYFVTNYHVVFNSNASDKNKDENGNKSLISRNITCYLYGSEGIPSKTYARDEDGAVIYDYGDYAIDCEYVGGSIQADLAVLRAATSDVLDVNEDARAVDIADGYHVGEAAVAIGNPNDGGISVTEGIVSVDNEYISLDIDGTARAYRSIRTDAALYGGNSGGGLFNKSGELIGISNAGDEEDQNINFAIPLEIVTGTVDNIIYYAKDGDSSTEGAYIVKLGVTVSSENSRFVYDESEGYGNIKEDVVLQTVASGSIAKTLGLKSGDILRKIYVGGEAYEVDRTFDISDAILTMRPGDEVKVKYERDGKAHNTDVYTLKTSEFSRWN